MERRGLKTILFSLSAYRKRLNVIHMCHPHILVRLLSGLYALSSGTHFVQLRYNEIRLTDH